MRSSWAASPVSPGQALVSVWCVVRLLFCCPWPWWWGVDGWGRWRSSEAGVALRWPMGDRVGRWPPRREGGGRTAQRLLRAPAGRPGRPGLPGASRACTGEQRGSVVPVRAGDEGGDIGGDREGDTEKWWPWSFLLVRPRIVVVSCSDFLFCCPLPLSVGERKGDNGVVAGSESAGAALALCAASAGAAAAIQKEKAAPRFPGGSGVRFVFLPAHHITLRGGTGGGDEPQALHRHQE